MEMINCGRFEGLKEGFPFVYELCYCAEHRASEVYGKAENERAQEMLAKADYVDCIVALRKALEGVLGEIVRRYGVAVDSERETPSIDEMITALEKKGLMNFALSQKCHQIRMDGNSGAHAHSALSLDMLRGMVKRDIDSLEEITKGLLMVDGVPARPRLPWGRLIPAILIAALILAAIMGVFGMAVSDAKASQKVTTYQRYKTEAENALVNNNVYTMMDQINEIKRGY